jgi:hypothetical protein
MGRSCGLRSPRMGAVGGQSGSEPGEIVGNFLIVDAGCSGGQSPGGQKACSGCVGAPGHRARGSGTGQPSTRYARCWVAGWAAQAAGRHRRGNGPPRLGAREWPGGPGRQGHGVGYASAWEWAGHATRWAGGGAE